MHLARDSNGTWHLSGALSPGPVTFALGKSAPAVVASVTGETLECLWIVQSRLSRAPPSGNSIRFWQKVVVSSIDENVGSFWDKSSRWCLLLGLFSSRCKLGRFYYCQTVWLRKQEPAKRILSFYCFNVFEVGVLGRWGGLSLGTWCVTGHRPGEPKPRENWKPETPRGKAAPSWQAQEAGLWAPPSFNGVGFSF